MCRRRVKEYDINRELRARIGSAEGNLVGAVNYAAVDFGIWIAVYGEAYTSELTVINQVNDVLNRNSVRVIQPQRLLDGLLEAYQPPKPQATWMGKVTLPAGDLLARLQEIAGDGGLVRTGVASAVEYAAWAGEPLIACYCRSTPTTLLARLGGDAKETLAFANLRLIQTDDQLIYFDARPNLAASPIQAWLEMASGDKRQKEVADQICRAIPGATGGAA